MKSNTRARRRLAVAGAVAALTIVASLPATASAQVGDVLNGLGLGSGSGADVGGAPDSTPGNPHAQGTVAGVDVGAPEGTEPLLGAEEAVVGRSGAQQDDDGSYEGGVTILALLGEEILGVETSEGEAAHSPLQPLQEGLLDEICAGSGGALCLQVLVSDSESNANGSTNDFGVLRADSNIGDRETSVGVAESSASLTEDGNCQTATATSGVARANVLDAINARVLQSEASDTACTDSSSSSGDGTVAEVQGNDLPLPGGCDGVENGGQQIATVAGVSCNAASEDGSRTAAGVEVLPGQEVASDGAAASSATAAQAPEADTAQGPGDDTGTSPTDDPTTGGPGDGPGDGDDTSTGGGGGAGSAAGDAQPGDGDGTLAFTGANVSMLALIGLALVALGIGIASRRPRARASA